MPKISNLPDQSVPNSNTGKIVIGANTAVATYSAYLGEVIARVNRLRMKPQVTDCIGSAVDNLYPFVSAAVGGGTLAILADVANHPGIVRITSAAAANSGAYLNLPSATAVLIGGSEVFECVVRPQSLTNVGFRLGFYDVFTSGGAQVDGAVFVHAAGGQWEGRCFNNSASTATATNYAVATGTWYRLKIEVNAAANLVTFYIYSEAGALLWSDTVSSNIPTAAGRETGCGILSYKTTITATALLDIDWMTYYNNKILTR